MESFGIAMGDHNGRRKESTEKNEFDSARERFPESTLLATLGTMSGGDRFLIDGALNIVGEEFLAFGVFEKTTKSQTVDTIKELLMKLSDTKEYTEKYALAKNIVNHITQ